MNYKRIHQKIFIRVDKGENLIDTIKIVCQQEKVVSGTYKGIGACDYVKIGTYIPELKDYMDTEVRGTLEMVSMLGNITLGENESLDSHTHAAFSYLENDQHQLIAGHLKDARVGYTAEIDFDIAEIDISRKFDDETGIYIWDF